MIQRCETCYLRKIHCLCLRLGQKLATKTRLSLVVHSLELKRLASNTSHLIPMLLSNSHLELVGSLESPITYENLILPDHENLFLFPSPNALTVDQISLSKPINLIVPDGSWSQARKIYRSHPVFHKIRKVQLPFDIKGRYSLRRPPNNPEFESVLCTFEAIAHSLRALEGEELFQKIMPAFEHFLTAISLERNKFSPRYVDQSEEFLKLPPKHLFSMP